MIEFPRSAAQSYYTVGPLECFTTDTSHRELTREMELEASRFLYSLCRIVNPTTEPRASTPTSDYTEQESEPTTSKITIPAMTTEHATPDAMTTEPEPDAITTEPRASTPTSDYTEQETEPTTWKITIPAMTTEHATPDAMTTTVSTTEGVVNEVSTSQATPSEMNTPTAHTSDKAAQTMPDVDSNNESPATPAQTVPTFNSDTESPTTTSSPEFSPSVTRLATPSNNTQALGDSNGDLTSFDQEASTEEQNATALSWQLGMAWALLTILFLMFVLSVGYFINKRRGPANCHGCQLGLRKKKKQQTLAEAYGFPEVRLRSRSGELDLSDARRSIEAGSYNVKSATIAYGESFYM